MKKTVLLGVILPLILTACSIVLAATRVQSSAWNDACTLSKYSCEDIDPPRVEYDDVALVEGLYGYYMIGTRVIFVSVGLEPDNEYSVLVHEMVHYLQYQTAKRNHTPMPGKCEAEREAFEVSDQILVRLGLPELARNGNVLDYGCK